MPEILVFAGPTLARLAEPERERLARRRFRFLPPARRGDVLRALCEDPAALVLLDGYYYTVPAVSHKELMYALDHRVPVLGAASLGALRAAELEPWGMVGVGRIFRWFRDGTLDGDDEVAVLHGPEDAGYRPLTVALVEVRQALAELVAGGSVEEAAGEHLLASCKSLPFTERFPERLEAEAGRILGEAAAAELRRRLADRSLKLDDARQALELAERPPPPAPAPPRSAVTRYLSYYREWELGPPELERPRYQRAWQAVQVLHPAAVDFVAALRCRFLLASAAIRAGLPEPAAERQRLRSTLDELGRRSEGGLLLPAAELVEEARLQARATQACRELGGVDGALAGLARSLGLSGPTGRETLARLLERQNDLLAPFDLGRSFVLTTLLPPALELAEAAAEVDRAFRAWAGRAEAGRAEAGRAEAGSSQIREDDLRRLAAELWGCGPAEVDRQAAQRGLFPSDGYSAGWQQALAGIAAAERLGRPINAYPRRRDALRSTALDYPFDLATYK